MEALEKCRTKNRRPSTIYPSESTDGTKIKNQFLACYKKTFGREYPGFGAKENAQAKSWLRSCSLEKALVLCEFFCRWNDAQAARRGHAFGDLVARWVELSAWCEDSEGQTFRIAQSRVAERLALKKAEETLYVYRIAEGSGTKQTTNAVKLGYSDRAKIPSET